MAQWRASVLTLFPEMFPGALAYSLAGRALQAGVWALQTVNIRDFATDRHRSVDDTPFGGGAGMVLRPDVVDAAIGSVADNRPLVFLTPRGRVLTQSDVRRYADCPGVVLLCGRYEGVDQRVIEARAMEEVSIGDYVLSGGELPALVLLDAAVRLLPGVMGAAESAAEESSRSGCWNTHTIRGLPSGRDGGFRMCCSLAITPRLLPGGRRRRNGSPVSAGRTSGLRARPIASPATDP